MNTSIIGSGPDPYQYIWNADVFAQNFKQFQNPFFTDRLAYPTGVSLLMHTYTAIIGLINVVIGNPYLSCNLALLLSFSVGGLGAYLLARDFIKSNLLALLVGFCFAFSPYMTSHLQEHYHLMLIAAVPFFIRALMRVFKEGKLSISNIESKQVWIMLVCFVITLFSDYYTSFFLIFSVVFYILFLLIRRWNFSWSWWKICIAVIGLIILSHIIVEPLYLKGLDNKGAFYNTADLLSLMVPAENSLLYGNLFENFRFKLDYKGPNEQVMFVGFILLILFVLVPKSTRTNKLNALRFLSLMFFFLCLPKIKLMGNSITYSPTAWIHYVPFLNNIRNPTRFVAMLYLFMPIISFYHWEEFWADKKHYVIKTALTMVLLFTLVIEYWPKSYSFYNKVQVNEYVDFLKDEDVQVLWHIPTGIGDGFTEVGHFNVQFLQDQVVHQKKYLGAYISRVPASLFDEHLNEPMFITARQAGMQHSWEPLHQELVQAFLHKYKVDCIVLQNFNEDALNNFVRLQFQAHIRKVVKLKEQTLFYLDSDK
ncbi:MAG: hypothetical protein JXR19_04080 [Bacteroidia bacterium]